MEPPWRHHGRGRGRGDAGPRSRPLQKERARPGAERAIDKIETKQKQTVVSVESRFEEIRKSNLAAAQRLVESGFSSSSSSCDEDEDVESKEGKRGRILESTFTCYNQTGGDGSGLQRTGQYVSELFESGAVTCLICIGSVRRTQPVWSCSGCFSLFHLPCVQKWARDSVFLVSSVTDEDFGQRQHPWPCPKCRAEYPPSTTPNRYLCYCGKVQDPAPDPWLVPHSCGSVCEKRLRPDCGHTCLLLCHPGPCPPCPKMVSVSCLCGKATPLPRRCSNKSWSCEQVCGKLLPCDQHTCSQLCHSECEACPKVSEQSCVCGKEKSLRPCAQPQWNCARVCGRPLSCGNHLCEEVCHSAPCPPCPRSVNRTCPCGKTQSSAGCAEEVLPCGDTCDHPLTCGKHTCSRRCHRGNCDTCRQEVDKECRCGKHRRMMACHKEYLCDSKCTNTRSCSRHQCKRKCCPGECPPCDLNCGRTLGCRNHKCPSVCHQGACYPCPETVQVSCTCGQTVLVVPCGRERSTRPPRCKEICRRPPECHHPSRLPHRCHPGPCPPCVQPCERPLLRCEHVCPRLCHDQVQVQKQQVQLSGPWEQPTEPAFVKKALPCPPCEVPVPMSCFGEHEVSPVPCHHRGPFSCGRQCGRPLTCTNHTCTRECHPVTPGNKCEECTSGCLAPRPPGCPHPCPRPCHSGHCPSCPQAVRQRCHCKISTLYISCIELTSSDDETKIKLGSCNNQCPKQLSCGHRCRLLCHPGPCEEKCVHKIRLRCPCRRVKKELQCHLSTGSELKCDDACQEQQRRAVQVKEAELKAVQEEELRKQQEELEAFERRMKGGAGRRNKRRRKGEESEEEGRGLWGRQGLSLVVLSVGVALLAVTYFYLTSA